MNVTVSVTHAYMYIISSDNQYQTAQFE